MAVTYTREFLIAAFLSRFISLPADKFASLHDMAEKFYDEKGRDSFRTYCSLDADAVKKYEFVLP